jgi:hypothetical protein
MGANPTAALSRLLRDLPDNAAGRWLRRLLLRGDRARRPASPPAPAEADRPVTSGCHREREN